MVSPQNVATQVLLNNQEKVKKSKGVVNEDRGAFLGHAGSGRELWSNGMSVEMVAKINTIHVQATKCVMKDVRWICTDGNEGEDNLADKIMEQDGFGNRMDEAVFMDYSPPHAGQAASAAQYNPMPFRRDHYEKHVRGGAFCSAYW